MSLHAVIMAGGIGSRFWPRSRRATPKQFLDVFGEASMIQNTFARLQPLVEPENVLVVTNADYIEQTHAHLPAVPRENVLGEPVARNTAPCVALAAARLHALDPDATMVVLPADHLITNVERFHEVLQAAAEAAQPQGDGPGPLVTIGIRPTHPETGYGYIQFDADGDTDGIADDGTDDAPRAHRVLTFAEKPDLQTAERFLDAGDFLWNSGMFIWRADAILAAFERYLPKVYALFAPLEDAFGTPREAEAIADAYERSPKISIDYGVMEQADSVLVVPGSFGWSDVGDWRAVHELSDQDEAGNRAEGNVILKDTARSFARSTEDRLLVLVGMEDAVVVDTGDAVLVCHREQAQKVKDVVDFLGVHGMDDYT
ncbi:mannose-1-phosphate guanylyltransferase [Rubrivirga litoralis]|uniref:Mannose-1-phosphate guanylyltransferase n=1 Tax=Rubrivirga litoralis TaxID=3075598 RepID=A0ABU3BP02_9BACT|nr:mannose-1-phosphate guanylyltransferase [Rubrivirga sp. F394]MDT0631017.1 mannose-1-phosphate guanylyltransferase [Rubrivirga sp. F394]